MSSRKSTVKADKPGSIVRLDRYTPRRLRAHQAAQYMGVSETTFLARVKAQMYPPSRKEVGATFWLRDDLDAYIDLQFGVTEAEGLAGASEDPFAARFKKAS